MDRAGNSRLPRRRRAAGGRARTDGGEMWSVRPTDTKPHLPGAAGTQWRGLRVI